MLKIKQLRTERGITQIHAAKTVGVSQQTLSRWERNEGLPDAGQMKKLAHMYHVSVNELYEEDIT